MNESQAIAALGALAQQSRLKAFRLLVKAGSDGLSAGAIAAALDVPHNTLSTHLAELSQAGLAERRRDGRRIIYRADYGGARELLRFLLEDCCRGSPSVCRPAVESLLDPCCPTPIQPKE